jgi:hypothetical protein
MCPHQGSNLGLSPCEGRLFLFVHRAAGFARATGPHSARQCAAGDSWRLQSRVGLRRIPFRVAGWVRTTGLRLIRAALSPLSYGDNARRARDLNPRQKQTRPLRRISNPLPSTRLGQLSKNVLLRAEDSNLQSPGPEPGVLPGCTSPHHPAGEMTVSPAGLGVGTARPPRPRTMSGHPHTDRPRTAAIRGHRKRPECRRRRP